VEALASRLGAYGGRSALRARVYPKGSSEDAFADEASTLAIPATHVVVGVGSSWALIMPTTSKQLPAPFRLTRVYLE
jgi:hypothetical protein